MAAQQPDAQTLARLRKPEGLTIHWIAKDGEAPSDCKPPYVGLSGDHFIRPDSLRHIVEAAYAAHTAFQDAQGAAVVQALPFRWERSVAFEKQALPEGAAIRLSEPLAEGPALGWLLSTGPKSQDGFMARHFDRHLSLALSRSLLDTFMTPNMMTVISCLLGLAGSALFLRPDLHLAGAGLVWLHSVLDGCDGELARIKFQESPLGAAIDFWGDNLVHLALFGCLAYGFYRADNSVIPLALGLAAALGTLGSALLVYLGKQQRRANPLATPVSDAPLGTALSRLENLLAQRDFIYLLLLLAYLGRTYEFLWAGAVGALLFFVMTVYLGRVNREQASSQPHYPG